MLWNTLLLALRAIRRNLLRSFLTTLGVVIGVSAVITMVTLGRGATAAVSERIASLGSNLLMLRPGARLGPGRGFSGGPDFKTEDVQALRTEISGLRGVAPVASKSVTVVHQADNWTTSVTGSTNAYFEVGNWQLAAGRIFTDIELRAGRSVCILGDTVRRELFRTQNPIGSSIRVGAFSCDVIGWLASKGQTAMGRDQDDTVIMPLRTVQRRLTGNLDVNMILISVQDDAAMERVKAQIETLMRERRNITGNEEDNFNLLDTRQIAQALSGTTQVLTVLLGAVAAVSLLVGGIGIMNIMLVSVTERTREIGIRLAIGALEREVLLQFLVEAVALSSLGGVVGVGLALAASIVLAQVMQVPFIFDPVINLVAFLFSAAIGVVFGFFPARRAASLNPIDALRHE